MAPSGAWTLQLEAVTLPAVSRCWVGRGPQSLPGVQKWSVRLCLCPWEAPEGQAPRLWACSLLLTLGCGLIILHFFSLGHCDPWA